MTSALGGRPSGRPLLHAHGNDLVVENVLVVEPALRRSDDGLG